MTDLDIDYSQEIWKPIAKFGDLYEVSNMGRIRSLDKIIPQKDGRARPMRGRILTPSLDSKGYYYFKFRQPHEARNERKNYRVHRLVAEAFLGESELPIDHINNNRKDNRDCNLQYVTVRENSVKGQADFRGTDIKDRNVHYNRFSRKWVFALKYEDFHLQERYGTKQEAINARDSFLDKNPQYKIREIKLSDAQTFG